MKFVLLAIFLNVICISAEDIRIVQGLPTTRCLQYTTCDQCILAPDCGWCTTGKCVPGNSTGPYNGECPDWDWNSCNATTTGSSTTNPSTGTTKKPTTGTTKSPTTGTTKNPTTGTTKNPTTKNPTTGTTKNPTTGTTGTTGATTGTTGSTLFKFSSSQKVAGMTVNCLSTNQTETYTECNNLTVNYGGNQNLFFPNGVTCGPTWSNVDSAFSDTSGFCYFLTQGGFSSYYVCDSQRQRAVWQAMAWRSPYVDNGLTQHVRCYYP